MGHIKIKQEGGDIVAKVTREQSEMVKKMILNAAAKSFLEKGFTNTTVKSITSKIGISTGAFNSHFRTKEDVLCELVSFVLNQQFAVSEKMVAGQTDDKLLLYATETVLQLHIVEMNENMRDVYCAAYSLPKPSALIQQTVTAKLEHIFKEHLPHLETKDFYMLEIATGGIMRGFMTVPCNMWFSMDMKVESFLKSTFHMYKVPDKKINEAIAFVKTIDFKKIAEATIMGIIQFLEKQQESFQ